MKKLFVFALAFAAFASCNKVESLDVASERIAFGDTFVEVKTREAVDPSTTTATINAFDVWGFMDVASGTVFAGERVTKTESGEWTYQNLQYWLPVHNYYFYAVSPVEDPNISINVEEINTTGIGEITFTNADGTCDLLYASKLVITPETIAPQPDKVTLQFAHLLSKLKFTFTNAFTNANTSIKVKNITITDAPGEGVIALNVEQRAWKATADKTTVLNFGNANGGEPIEYTKSAECDAERLTISADNTRRYNIEFDVELYYGDKLGLSSHKVIKLEGQTFEIGKQYNLTASITPENITEEALKPIEFDVIVEEWVDGVFDGKIDWDDDDSTTDPENPTATPLATPVVKSEVAQNVVTLSWEAIEGADKYNVTCGTDIVVVEGTSYQFTGDYATEYTFTIVALPADESLNTVSDAATVTVTTENEPVVAPTYTSVADFLAADVDATVEYTLKGTITRVANTTYGNFDLTDETGTVYIYGLVSEDGATNKYWAASGAKLGDDIVIKTVRAEYNGSAQGSNAKFIELVSPGSLAFYVLDSKAVNIPYTGGEGVVNVTAYNTDATVTATSDNAAFTVNVDGYKVTISAVANELEQDVTGVVTIKLGELAEQTVNVTLDAKPAAGEVAGGKSDFNTVSATNTSYVSGKTTAGWSYVNCAVLKGGTSDSNPTFKMIGADTNRALCMNGKTSAVGTITSPTITTGCGTLKFNYGLPFGDTQIKFRVDIKQAGTVVKTFTVNPTSVTKLTKYEFEESVNIAGEFQIVLTNLSPSNSTSNKDRTAIWDVEWTGCN